MFFFDRTDFLIFSGFFDISIYPGSSFPVGLPPLSWTTLPSFWVTGDMLARVFDHQASLTSPGRRLINLKAKVQCSKRVLLETRVVNSVRARQVTGLS